MSDDGSIDRFEPRSNAEHDSPDALVWAIDDEHVPAYWFPRDCPRGTFWAIATTSDGDVERFLTGDRARRVHAIQSDWLDRVRREGRGQRQAYKLRRFQHPGQEPVRWTMNGADLHPGSIHFISARKFVSQGREIQ